MSGAAGVCQPSPKEVILHIQYLGFQLKAQGRDYIYKVIDKSTEEREFVFTIFNRTFMQSGVPYQDAADLCYQKLQKALSLETAEQPFPRRSTLSDQELKDYRLEHRPARKRTW